MEAFFDHPNNSFKTIPSIKNQSINMTTTTKHHQVDSSDDKEEPLYEEETFGNSAKNTASNEEEEETESKRQASENDDEDDDSHENQAEDDEIGNEDASDDDTNNSNTSEIDKKKKNIDKQQNKSVFGEAWLAETENFNEKLKKRGVVYVARVPPRMTPTKMKTLLSEFGQVTRVYLVEEDKTVRQRRRKQGGSGSKRYAEGWIEFEKKKVAKHVAQSLNTTPISNYKRNAHYGAYNL
jgi:ESF2/ABP1 family protein